MELLVPNATDAAGEKHLPIITAEDGAIRVNAGTVNHSMADEHYIEWVCDAPEAIFCVGENKPVALYAYCKLHELWMEEIEYFKDIEG